MVQLGRRVGSEKTGERAGNDYGGKATGIARQRQARAQEVEGDDSALPTGSPSRHEDMSTALAWAPAQVRMRPQTFAQGDAKTRGEFRPSVGGVEPR